MNGLRFLLYCTEILGVLLCGAQSIPEPPTADFLSHQNPTPTTQEDNTNADSIIPASQTHSPADLTSATARIMSEATTQSPKTVSKSRSATPSPGPQFATTFIPNPSIFFYKRECLPAFAMAGGLIIACTILLVSTLLLTWKVCQLSRRIKMLSSNADLISTSEYWTGTAKKNKSTSETEAKETTVLMTDISQTLEEVGNGTTKEDGGKVNEDGQMGEGNNKELGDSPKSDEASTTPVTVAENASSSKPQEEATESQSTKAVAASSSEGTEEPKDVV